MKTLLLFLVLLLASTSGSSATRIIFVNGINVEDDGRQESVDQIRKLLRNSGFLPKFGGEEAIIESITNPTDGLFSDINELVRQAKYSSEALTIAKLANPTATTQTPQYQEQLGDLYAQRILSIGTSTDVERRILLYSQYLRDKLYERVITNSDKVVVVAHSQGTFFAEAANAYLIATVTPEDRLKLDRGLRFVSVASVAASSPNGRYISAVEDGALILQGARTALIDNYSQLKRNIFFCTVLERAIPTDPCYVALLFRDPLIHEFIDIYASNLSEKSSGEAVSKLLVDQINTSIDEISPINNPQLYSIISLGDMQPTALNDHGDIVGICGDFACIRLSNGGGWQSLGTLFGLSSIALSIDNFGQAVGFDQKSQFSGDTHAFKYSGIPGSTLIDLAPDVVKIGQFRSEASSISANGRFIAGNVFQSDGIERAFLLTGDGGQELGTLPGHSFTVAEKVNNNGLVVGSSFTPKVPGPSIQLYSAFIRPLNSAIAEIPPLIGRRSSRATYVNNFGVVVGYFSPISSDQQIGFSYSKDSQSGAEAFIEIRDGNKNVVPRAINDRGEIVGWRETPNAIAFAFVYHNGILRNLNQLIPANTGWILRFALANNNRGQIIGTGILDGQSQAFLLTPVQ